MSTIRAFVATNLPVKAIDPLRDYQRRLQGSLESWRPGISWTSPASLHLTLRFLGEIEEPLVAALGDRLSEAAARCETFDFTLGGVGAFPSLQRARVLWAGATGDGLLPLATTVEDSLEQIGLPREERPFSAHITLGRLKSPLNLAPVLGTVALFPPTVVTVREIILYSSRLTPKGAIYQTLRRAPLRRATTTTSASSAGSSAAGPSEEET